MFGYCHSCGGEFQPTVSTCPDCNEPLHSAPAETSGPATPTGTVAPLEDRMLLKIGEPWELRELAESLQAHGISSQIDRAESGARLGIYVARGDVDAVREFAAQLAASELADGGAAEHDPAVCPACGEPTPENAAACASCGLEFPEIQTDDR